MFERLAGKKFLQNATLSLAALLVAVGLIEGTVRLGGPPDLNASPLWRFHPTYGWTIDPATDRVEPVTRTGFRHRPVATEKPAGTRRLLVLGDSFAQATGIPYSQTFPGVFEYWLNREASGETWEVVNLGVGDWGSGQQLIALTEYGLGLDPDVVVLQVFPFNDLCNNSIALAETCSMQDHHRPYFEIDDGELRIRHLSAWRAWLRSRLISFGVIENRVALSRQVGLSRTTGDFGDLARRRNDFFAENAERRGLPYAGAMASLVPESEQPTALREAWEVSSAILAEMAARLSRRGIPLVAAVVPYKHSFSRAWQRFEARDDKPFRAEHGTEGFERILAQQDVPVVSVRDAIRTSGMQTADFFRTTDSHFDAYGHFRFATWVLETLRSEGLTEAAPPEVEFRRGDLIDDDGLPTVRITGLGVTRQRQREGPRWRHAPGPRVSLVFAAHGDQAMRLRFRLVSLVERQGVVVRLNGHDLTTTTDAERSDRVFERTLDFLTQPGRNEIEFLFRPDPGGTQGPSPAAKAEGGAQAGRFEVLRLTPADDAP